MFSPERTFRFIGGYLSRVLDDEDEEVMKRMLSEQLRTRQAE